MTDSNCKKGNRATPKSRKGLAKGKLKKPKCWCEGRAKGRGWYIEDKGTPDELRVSCTC